MSEELRKLIQRAADVLRAAGAREIYVFGSTAAEDRTEPADVDLAVSGLAPERFFTAMGDAADILDRPLDLVDLDEDTPFTRYLRTQGVLQRV